jgi:hypothetical protein
MMGTNMLRYRFATIVMAIASPAGFAFSQTRDIAAGYGFGVLLAVSDFA